MEGKEGGRLGLEGVGEDIIRGVERAGNDWDGGNLAAFKRRGDGDAASHLPDFIFLIFLFFKTFFFKKKDSSKILDLM